MNEQGKGLTNCDWMQFHWNADRLFQRMYLTVPMLSEVLVEVFHENKFVEERYMSVRVETVPQGVDEHCGMIL